MQMKGTYQVTRDVNQLSLFEKTEKVPVWMTWYESMGKFACDYCGYSDTAFVMGKRQCPKCKTRTIQVPIVGVLRGGK